MRLTIFKNTNYIHQKTINAERISVNIFFFDRKSVIRIKP